MRDKKLLSKFVEKIELEILTTEECAFIGGAADSTSTGNNCKCNGNNCDCNNCGNNCRCNSNNCDCEIPVSPIPDVKPYL